ncbi:urokinase plasminogen activator surface receptor [Dendrobates tinctorius]|uniref:urokinase plasminogen activator surface receptor n=1 Tax=Dendrobates tinctorius TaxID=92724 RepID=UPI003CC9DDE5
MKLFLRSGLYSTLLYLAVGLQCYHYKGVPDHATTEQTVMTCDSTKPHCSSTIMTYSGLLHVGVLTKGCSSGETCNQTLTGSLKHIDTSQTSHCCDKDLCNQDLVPDLGEDSWTECLACQGQPLACGGSDLPSLRCEPSQKSCIELSITTTLSQDTRHTMIKSCSNTSTCPGLAAFSNGQNHISYASSPHCCKGSQCNRGHFKDADPGSENGLECYSHSSPGESGTMKCRGPMTQCMDLIGSSPDDVVMSGCATEAFCQGLYPQFNIPGWKNTLCCGHSRCNHNHKKGTKGGSDE